MSWDGEEMWLTKRRTDRQADLICVYKDDTVSVSVMRLHGGDDDITMRVTDVHRLQVAGLRARLHATELI